MKANKLSTKLVGGLVALVLLMTGNIISSQVTSAAGLPTIRVVTPEFNPLNETFAKDELGKYYAAGGRSFFKYVGAGSTITMTYLITTDGTEPAAGKAVSFLVNAPYSGSNATWEIDGKAVGASQNSDAGYGLKVSGTTDTAGRVSFTIKNTNSTASAMEIPASETQPRALSGRVYGNMKLVIDGLSDMQQISDLLTFDITKAAAETLPAGVTPTPTPTATPTATPTPPAPAALPSMRLISPEFGPTNSVDTTGGIAQYYSAKTRAYYTYIAAGTTLSLKYLVTKDGTNPLANTKVTLQVNAPYSLSKANWLSGSTKIGAPASDSAAGAELSGTTDSKGEVTFVIKNTDTTGFEAKPLTPTTPAPKDRLYGTFKAIIPGYGDKQADVDLVTFDIYAAPKPPVKATKITCVKGKLQKTVTAVNPKCPAGYKKK
jgi:hypothetical protein